MFQSSVPREYRPRLKLECSGLLGVKFVFSHRVCGLLPFECKFLNKGPCICNFLWFRGCPIQVLLFWIWKLQFFLLLPKYHRKQLYFPLELFQLLQEPNSHILMSWLLFCLNLHKFRLFRLFCFEEFPRLKSECDFPVPPLSLDE